MRRYERDELADPEVFFLVALHKIERDITQAMRQYVELTETPFPHQLSLPQARDFATKHSKELDQLLKTVEERLRSLRVFREWWEGYLQREEPLPQPTRQEIENLYRKQPGKQGKSRR